MKEIRTTELWLESIFNINKELDFERERVKDSLKRIDKMENEREEIFNIIQSINDPTYKAILYKRYIQGKKWEVISDELHYVKQHLHRLKSQSIEEVHKIINNK